MRFQLPPLLFSCSLKHLYCDTLPGCLISRDCDNLQNFIAINKSVKSHRIIFKDTRRKWLLLVSDFKRHLTHDNLAVVC